MLATATLATLSIEQKVRRRVKKVDHDQRREEVAAAAAKIIAESGMAGLTTRALAQAMGCSIGVLSHYFSSKDEIVLAAFEWADSNINRRMEAVITENPNLDAFIPVIKAGLPLTEETDMEWRVRFNLYSHNLTRSEDLVKQNTKLQNFRVLMNGLIGQMQERGEVRRDLSSEDITSAAFDLVMGAAQNLLMIPLQQRERYTETIFRLLDALRSR